MTKRIALSGKRGHGLFALVDDEDYGKLASYSWHLSRIYARRTERVVLSDGRVTAKGTFMHRQIMKPKPGEETDHINGDGIDNRRANLRIVNRLQNAKNQSKETKRACSSRYKGVSWNKNERKWWAYIAADKERRSLIGKFATEEQAARAYDAKALELHGDFARLNFPSN